MFGELKMNSKFVILCVLCVFGGSLMTGYGSTPQLRFEAAKYAVEQGFT